MYFVKGEIRNLKDREFKYEKDGKQQTGREVAIIVEGDNGDHVEVRFAREQIEANLPQQFAQVKGRVMTLPVDISERKGYVNVYLSRSFVFSVAPAAASAAPGAGTVAAPAAAAR